MKKLLLALLMTVTAACFAGGPSSNAQFTDPVPVANGGTGAQLASDARVNLNVYSKEEVDQAVAAGELLYYPTASSSDVSGMYRFATSSSDLGLLVEYASDTAAVTTNGVYILAKSLMTPVGYPGVTTLRQGVYSGRAYAYRVSGNRDMAMETELWRCASDGSEISLIATGSEETVPTTNDGFAFIVTVPVDTTVLVTDRIKLKYYLEARSGTTATVVRFTTGGSKIGYFGIPVSRDLVCTLNTPQTLTNKTLDGSNVITGSSTVNFTCATATVSNITGLQMFKAHHTGTPPVGVGGVWEVFDPATDDISNTNYSNGTWTAPVTGIYRISGVVQTGAVADTKCILIRSVVAGTPTADYINMHSSVDGEALIVSFCYVQKLLAGQTFSVQTTTNNTSDPLMTGSGCWIQIEQIR